MLKVSGPVTAFCHRPWKRLKVTPDGNVSFCCFQGRKSPENFLDHSLEELWASELAQDIRAAILQGDLHWACQSDSCPFHHGAARKAETVICSILPNELELDFPSQHCNIGGEVPNQKNRACLMCERNLKPAERFTQEDHLTEICEKLRPYLKHIEWLHLQGISEPFWKDRIFGLFDSLGLEEHRERIWISTTTNGTLVNKERRAKFLHFPKSTMTWSLDAATSETYRIIRRTKMYQRIIENLRAYMQERSEGQYVHIHNNINTINIYEVVQMVELAAEIGVNRLEFNSTYGYPGICVNKDNAHLFYQAQLEIMKAAERLGVYTTFMRPLALNYLDPPQLTSEQAGQPAPDQAVAECSVAGPVFCIHQ